LKEGDHQREDEHLRHGGSTIGFKRRVQDANQQSGEDRARQAANAADAALAQARQAEQQKQQELDTLRSRMKKLGITRPL